MCGEPPLPSLVGVDLGDAQALTHPWVHASTGRFNSVVVPSLYPLGSNFDVVRCLQRSVYLRANIE